MGTENKLNCRAFFVRAALSSCIFLSSAQSAAGDCMHCEFHLKGGGIPAGLDGLKETAELCPRPPSKPLPGETEPFPNYGGSLLSLGQREYEQHRASFNDPAGFKSLRQLSLSEVNLEDLTFIRNLPNLREVDIGTSSQKDLTQALVSALATCPSLQKLSIVGDVSKVNLSAFKQSESLREMYFAGAQIKPDTINQLSSIPNLESLEFSRCSFDAQSMGLLPSLAKLADLKLTGPFNKDGTDFTPDLSFLKGLPNLRSLKLLAVNVNEPAVVAITTLKNLTELDVVLPENQSLSFLQELPSLTALCLRFQSQWHKIVSLPAKNLQYLSLEDNDVSHEVFAQIAAMKSLKGLDLSMTPITDDEIVALANLTGLKRIVLRGLSCAIPYSAYKLSQELPDCAVIYSRTQSFSGPAAEDLAWSQPSNKYLFSLLYPNKRPDLPALHNSSRLPPLESRPPLIVQYLKLGRYEDCILLCEATLKDLACDTAQGKRTDDTKPSVENRIRRQREAFTRLNWAECLSRSGRHEEANAILVALPLSNACNLSDTTLYCNLLYCAVASIANHREDANENVARLLDFADRASEDSLIGYNFAVREKLALAYCEAGEFERALSFQNEAMSYISKKLGSSYPVARTCLAIRAKILERQNRLQEAETDLKTAVSSPDNFTCEAAFDLADMYEQYAGLMTNTNRKRQAAVLMDWARYARNNPPPMGTNHSPPFDGFSKYQEAHPL